MIIHLKNRVLIINELDFLFTMWSITKTCSSQKMVISDFLFPLRLLGYFILKCQDTQDKAYVNLGEKSVESSSNFLNHQNDGIRNPHPNSVKQLTQKGKHTLIALH